MQGPGRELWGRGKSYPWGEGANHGWGGKGMHMQYPPLPLTHHLHLDGGGGVPAGK